MPIDPTETDEWLTALDDVLDRHGPEAVQALLAELERAAALEGVSPEPGRVTPYVNSIAPEDRPAYPGDLAIEARLTAAMRWNAAVMVVRANRRNPGLGGHISTYQSASTLFEVALHHFLRGGDDQIPDVAYFQGHAAPGLYARAYLEGRLSAGDLDCFRQESGGGRGLPSYPHPYLMPDFWQLPTVSMGLAPLMAIYQARFCRYARHRGLTDARPKIWCFVGDGELDEPEGRGALAVAAREELDDLVFVVNCNLQRLDGPVRGNGNIVQELESELLGCGWRVEKALWGKAWDRLFEADHDGALVRRLDGLVDGDLQRLAAGGPRALRDELFTGELAARIEGWSDDDLDALRRGGHDPEIVHAAYRSAATPSGAPTAVLAQTIKGYGLGASGEASNVTHQRKKLDEDELVAFGRELGIPMDDDALARADYYRPPEGSDELAYLVERRRALGGFVPARRSRVRASEVSRGPFERFERGTGDRPAATTMTLVKLLGELAKAEQPGERLVPIVPDEARTFGMDALFHRLGIYASGGQQYEPVDAGSLLHYEESRRGQILEEGITEAGALSSLIAAGTAYAALGVDTIPFFLFYSMFGFQRAGDLIWAAVDARAKGFLCGATAGRTTLAGEGLQHQDGHSQLIASAVPGVRAYDPAFSYEVAAIVEAGLERMLSEQEAVLYYLTLYNEPTEQPPMPDGAREGILRGLHRVRSRDGEPGLGRVQLLGSGPILFEVLRAQEILADDFGIGSDAWSATSYSELRRDAIATERWNRRRAPGEPPRTSYLERALAGATGPFVAASDWVRLVPEQIARFLPGPMVALGTDGLGLSDTREALRAHFEVDAGSVAFAALDALVDRGTLPLERLREARDRLLG